MFAAYKKEVLGLFYLDVVEAVAYVIYQASFVSTGLWVTYSFHRSGYCFSLDWFPEDRLLSLEEEGVEEEAEDVDVVII